MQRFKQSFFVHLKILISGLFMKLVSNIYASFQLKLHLLHLFRYVLEDPSLLAFYYVNYDLNNQYYNILEQIFTHHSGFFSLTFDERPSIDSQEKFYCNFYEVF